MTKPQIITLSLTEPQFHALIAASDVYYSIQMENQDRDSTRRAQVINRAADALSTAWQRALAGF